ncbi:MAG: MBL fold metallo-hydrolase [Alphaproteobacteria bacterium]|nr:MBL fold metallo-hydrolase [Alphaproteobacteria bacterium]
MTGYLDTGTPGDAELLFLALGGAGEIGMNLNLYGHAGVWLMVDLGITFGDESTPGIDVIMPDPSFIEERRDELVGLVLTHAHEDHLGAVAYLWDRLRCPVYATPFTAAVLRRKLAEAGLLDRVPLTEIPLSGRFSVGPFAIELITLTHSIPEPNALVIETPVGRVMHTGDWKLDPDPIVGPTTDEKALIRVGEAGVLAMVCDSTNVLVNGESGSEADVRDTLLDIVGRYEKRVAVACFASNVARLETIARVGAAHDRQVALVGRSLWRIYEAAKETGYLLDIPPFLAERDIGYLPRDKVLMICTGSQGEPRSALARIAAGDHPEVSLEAGDTVIFSSRIIPGNEISINRMHNRLSELGVELVTTNEENVHVSGHPARDELSQMYQWIRPRIAIPVHGEPRHLVAHAKLAQECQVPETVVVQNGAMVCLAPGRAEIIDEVFTGRLAVDGRQIVNLESGAIRDRRRMIHHGSAVATVILGRDGELRGMPIVSLHGIQPGEREDAILPPVVDAVCDAVNRLSGRDRANDELVAEAARRAVRRTLRQICGKRPHTEVHLVRV